ncbi:hypothetical protein CS063_01320 [Sporanaerobium hydrogeniformans]|uniref:Uncharacterized protein n=1 Tax=Sporanaerobium hydrogeniformans TaxID=3072179 RepID=A0AC61DH23_9FIRM|nr:MgtC/SapB family protein [Sporanaerobium hydrogeniformans]PHV72145.1 hypothetical protein CS063_01320 [Sporanaerobium hydrogeniformans]
MTTLEIILRLALACVCGGIIGSDRIKKRRPAGLKTHILVCIGATLTMIINDYMWHIYGGMSDPARLGAQVISGIGFLGAGTIIVTGKQQVKGLTTAAGLWASATMGLAIGVGYYSAAIIGCVFIFVVMAVVQKLDNMILAKSSYMELYIEFRDTGDIKPFIECLKKYNYKLLSLHFLPPSKSEETGIGAMVTLHAKDKNGHEGVVSLISEVQGVLAIEELS